MKKLLLTTSFISLFLLYGNTISAQASKNVINKIEIATESAVSAINKNSELKEADKKNFIARVEACAKYAKVNEDSKAETVFNQEYKKIAKNYMRITGKSLPELSTVSDEK